MKQHKIFGFLLLGLMFGACSNPLDKPFDRETAEADFARIVKLGKIDSADAYIMSHFMVEHDLIGAQVLELNATYRDILQESKQFWSQSNSKIGVNEVNSLENYSKDLAVTISPITGAVQQSEWSHGIKFHVTLENTSGKLIKAIKGNFGFYDAFGDRVWSIEYKYLDSLTISEKVERDVTMRIQNTATPQLILEYGKTNPFIVKWESTSLIF